MNPKKKKMVLRQFSEAVCASSADVQSEAEAVGADPADLQGSFLAENRSFSLCINMLPSPGLL